MTDEPELSEDEIEGMRRDRVLLAPGHEHATPEMNPRLWKISAGMMYAIIRAEVPAPPEYVTIPMPTAHVTEDGDWRQMSEPSADEARPRRVTDAEE